MVTDTATMLTAVAALAAVLGLVVFVGRLARIGGFAPRVGAGRRLAVQETLALDSRRRLHIVRCGEQHVLLLTGGVQDVVVGWLTERPSVVSGPLAETDR